METLLNFIYGYVIIADWYNREKKSRLDLFRW